MFYNYVLTCFNTSISVLFEHTQPLRPYRYKTMVVIKMLPNRTSIKMGVCIAYDCTRLSTLVCQNVDLTVIVIAF